MEVKRLHASIESKSSNDQCPKTTNHEVKDSIILQAALDTPETLGDSMEFKDSILCVINTHTMARSSSDDSNRSLSDYTENSSTTSDHPILIDTSLSPNSTGSVDSVGSLVLGSTGSEIEIFFPSALDILCRQQPLPRYDIVPECTDTDQIIKQLMTGYQCIQPFSKSLTDEELNEIFTHGLVSVFSYL